MERLLQEDYAEEIWMELVDKKPDLATKLSNSRIYNNRLKSLEEFENNMDDDQKSDKGFLIKLSDSNNFKFYSKFSIGSLYIQGFPKIIEGIKGFGQIEEIDEKST